MERGKFKLNVIAITLCCVLSAQSRPQSFDNDIFAVDGFSFDAPVDRLDPITFKRLTPKPVVSTPATPSTTLSTDRCMNTCLNTSEYNPVCGTDGVVYSNPGRLGCAQKCGKAVNLANYGPCASGNARG